MTKTISAKRVLNELLEEWNAQAAASGYCRATKDHATREQCDAAMASICEVIDALGFKEDVHYTAEKCEKILNETIFQCWRREAV